MVDISSAKLIINTISFLIAYLYVVTITGSFRAWIADRMGDSSAAESGYVTLNPLMHVSPIGIIFLLFYSFGWGVYVPINPFNIYGKWRNVRLVISYYSDTILNLALAILGLAILIVWFDPFMIKIVQAIVYNRDVSHLYIAQIYPQSSSLEISAGFILAAVVSLHVGLAVLEFLINTCMFGFYLLLGASMYYMEYSFYVIFLAPLLVMFFFYAPMLIIITQIISYTGYLLAYIIRGV
jgi:hypothetical protein